MLLLSKPPSVATATPFITMVTPGGSRHDYNDWIGFAFTVGAKALVISALGRWILPGNITPFQIGIFDRNVTGPSPSPLTSTTIDPTLTAPGNFGWSAPLSTPFTAAAGSSWVVAFMPVGTEDWMDCNGIITSSADATANEAVYYFNGAWAVQGSSDAYGVANFKYTIP